MNRDDILRRLAALRAKFSDGSNCSPNEVETAMRMYADLKAKYDISDTEEHIRKEGIERQAGGSFKTNKQVDVIYYIVPKIAKYTETRGLCNQKTGLVNWFGTRPDIEHAMWLYTLIQNALEQSWKAYRYSFDYTKLHRQGIHGRVIRNNFRKGFIANVAMRLDKMIEEKLAGIITNGTALVILKHELIQSFIEAEGIKSKAGRKLAKMGQRTSALAAGYYEGEKVGLQQTMKNETKLLEERKEEVA